MLDNRDYKYLKIGLLKKLCKIHKITRISKMNKFELVQTLNTHFAVHTIIKIFRRYIYKNAVDYISLEPVKYPCFIFNANGNRYFYNYENIVKYIVKTGDTKDPMTRIQYSDKTLKSIDKHVKLCKLSYRSVYRIKHDPYYTQRIRNINNEIGIYQTRLNEIKVLFLTGIESDITLLQLTEGFYVENTYYRSPVGYMNTLFNELKIVLTSFSRIDHEQAHEYILGLLEEIKTIRNQSALKFYNLIINLRI